MRISNKVVQVKITKIKIPKTRLFTNHTAYKISIPASSAPFLLMLFSLHNKTVPGPEQTFKKYV